MIDKSRLVSLEKRLSSLWDSTKPYTCQKDEFYVVLEQYYDARAAYRVERMREYTSKWDR